MIDATLTALADPTRRRVIELLGDGPHRAGDLAAACDMSRPAMSRHLRHLRHVGLAVELPDPEDGRARLYHLEQAPLLELRDWLDDVQQFWTDQLAGLADHLAKEQAP